jgi:hypothetical protein
MTRIAVELNDTGLQVARDGAGGEPVLVGEPSPGFAMLHQGRVLVGEEAARRHRLAPLHAQNRFWHGLGLEALPWSAQGVGTVADLAHAHLAATLASTRGDDANAELLLAVPPGYTRDQLGLLVGIANERGPGRGRHGAAVRLHAAPRPATAPGDSDADRNGAQRRHAAPLALRAVARRRATGVPAGVGHDDRDHVRARYAF